MARKPLEHLLTELMEQSEGRALLVETVRSDPEARTELTRLTEAWDQDPSTDFLRTGAALDGAAWRRVESRLRGEEPLEVGSRAGRYVIVERLGEGGMGVVYLAYDPELDRRVAIKVLHTAASGEESLLEARERLMHEARMLAQLSHAQVVAIHDVGTIQAQVFIAMEYVKGSDLAEWLQEKNPAWPEILGVFLKAGRGLEAAHRRDLVHRDFKPQNVLLGEDGAVRVADFGLAESPDPDQSDESGSSRALTGTPAYMAPEQLLDGRFDAASDQFAFCVALWEALYRSRPYPGTSIGEIVQGFRQGQLAEIDPKSSVPPWIGQILHRGLAVDPEDRWSSMTALLEALSDDPAQRRRKILWAGLASAAVVLSLVWGLTRTDAESLCTGMERHLEGVWDDSRRNLLESTFGSLGLAGSGGVLDRVTGALDDYSDRWVEQRVEACEATHLRGDQSEGLLDLRIACLDRRLKEVDAFITVLQESEDPTVLAASPKSAHSLESLDPCAQRDLLASPVLPPRDPEVRQRLAEVEQTLARLKAQRDLGQLSAVDTALPSLVAQAEEIGFAPLAAEVSYLEADVKERLGLYDEAESSAFRTWALALEGMNSEYILRTLSLLVYLDGNDRFDLDQAKRWGALGQAQLDILGKVPSLEAEFYNAMGVAHQQGSETETSLAYHHKALALREEIFGVDSLAATKSRNNIGSVYYTSEDFDRALENFQQVYERLNELLGDHADVSIALNNVGSVLIETGRYREAYDRLEEAQAMRLRVFSTPDIWVTILKWNLGNAQVHFDPASALSKFSEAKEELPQFVPPEHPLTAYPLSGEGSAYYYLERYPEAIDALEASIELREVSEPSSLLVARDRFQLAQAYWKVGRRTEALESARLASEELVDLGEGRTTRESILAWLDQRE